ncbi:small multi-drug export protein [bacterium LRH843]|nr:small multi-drug export protein [bacterium LRH843]
MALFIAYVVVFLLAAIPFFEVVGVIAIGVAAGLPAIPVTIIAFLGNMLTIVLLILLMDKVKLWMAKRREKKGKAPSKKKTERAERIWNRFGLPGLSIVSPILIGSHFGVILAMGFGGTKKQVLLWMTISIVAWSIVTGISAFYGFDFLYGHSEQGGFLVDLLKR